MRGSTLALVAAAAALVALAAASCGTPRRGEPLVGPLPIRDDEVARGEAVFHRFCQPCHPGGEAGLGPSLNEKPAPGFLIKTQVRLGLGAMPSFGSDVLPGDDLDALVAYMMAMRHHPGR